MAARFLELVETRAYGARVDKLLSPAERIGVELRIASDPTCGVLIAGTGGVRKVRVGRGSQGKSGGARVVYYFCDDSMPIYLLTIFAKNEKDNLSQAERNTLAKFVKDLKREHGRQS